MNKLTNLKRILSCWIPLVFTLSVIPDISLFFPSDLGINRAVRGHIPSAMQAQAQVIPTLSPTPPGTPAAQPSPTLTWRGPIIGGGYQGPPQLTASPVTDLTPGSPVPTTPPSSPQPADVGAVSNLDPNRIGVQVDINLSDSDWADAMARLETLGVQWVKVQVPWRDMQPSGPDQRDDRFFSIVERHIEDANRRGFDVLVSVVKAPAWARSTQEADGPPDNPETLANFIRLLFDEINAGDRPEDRALYGEYIDAIEIWNEPNLQREWTGTLPFNGAGYMQLFGPSYQAVRAYSSTVPVITAGLAPTGNNPGSVDDRDFLRQMYAAGLANYQDVVIGIHPYSWANSPDATCCGSRGWDDDPHFFYADTMREYRSIIANAGHNARMWITEVGYATWEGFPNQPPPGSEWMRFNSMWDQANYTLRMVELAQTSTDIENVMLWNLNFAVLAGLVENADERIAYSMIVPGTLCIVEPGSTNRTERPLFWMLYDALRPEVQLPGYCG